MPYLNVRQVESALLAAARPPNDPFTELITLPNRTWEGRTCRAIKIAKGNDSERMGVYFIGGVHAREWGSPDILISFIHRLIRAYRTNSGLSLGSKDFTAAQIQSIVDTLDVFVFPQVNPDGRNYSMTVDTGWRKNRRPAPDSHPDCPGVDINRNYDFLWNYPDYFHPDAPIRNSTEPCDPEVYIGPSAASEPETQNVVSMLDSHPNIRFFVDVHSYGEKILYGWGDDEEQITNPNMNFQNGAFNGLRGMADDDDYQEYTDPPDQPLTIELANRMRDAIQAVRGGAYEVETSFELYPTAGTSTDYADSRQFADAGKGKMYSYTIEWGSEPTDPPFLSPFTPFHPAYSEMRNIIREVTAGLLDFCLGTIELTQTSTPRTM